MTRLRCPTHPALQGDTTLQFLHESNISVFSQGPLFDDVGILAKCVIDTLRDSRLAVPPPAYEDAWGSPLRPTSGGLPPALLIVDWLRQEAAGALSAYSTLTVSVPSGWLEAVNAQGLLRELLDKVYVCTVSLALTAAELLVHPQQQQQQQQGGTMLTTAAAAASQLMGVLADVSFCRVPQLNLAADLTARLLPLLTMPSLNGANLLLQQLPCYADLVCPALPPAVQHPPGPPPTAAQHPPCPLARWQVDSVLVSKLLVLLPAVAACLPAAGEGLPAAASRLLPYAYLLLRHPQESACLAAHELIGSCLSALCAGGHSDLASQALPFYVQRSLQVGLPRDGTLHAYSLP